jgi:hypothetical protein
MIDSSWQIDDDTAIAVVITRNDSIDEIERNDVIA